MTGKSKHFTKLEIGHIKKQKLSVMKKKLSRLFKGISHCAFDNVFLEDNRKLICERKLT